MTLGPGVELSATWQFGPGAGVVVTVAGRILAALMLRPLSKRTLAGLWEDLPSIAASALSVGIAGVIYRALAQIQMVPAGSHRAFLSVMSSPACFLSASMYAILSTVITVIGLHARYGAGFWPLWWSEWAEVPVRFLIYFVAGLVLSWLYITIRVGVSGIIAFALFLVLMIYSTRLFVRMSEVYQSTVESLVPAIEAKILDGPGHSRRVSNIAVAMGRKMAMPREEIRKLYFGAMLHDVGLAAIDERILNKKCALTESEYMIVLTHVMAGANIVSKSSFLNGSAETILHHHERYDGSGHPSGLAGGGIPLGARIVCLAEAYDAMTQFRPYGARLEPSAALEEIRAQAGRQFDPHLVPVLEQVVSELLGWGERVFESNYRFDTDR
ncbi:MAG: HD-GYP domain-containing protein [Ignavibacteriales bacterium]